MRASTDVVPPDFWESDGGADSGPHGGPESQFDVDRRQSSKIGVADFANNSSKTLRLNILGDFAPPALVKEDFSHFPTSPQLQVVYDPRPVPLRRALSPISVDFSPIQKSRLFIIRWKSAWS